jgi:hypothetical protein
MDLFIRRNKLNLKGVLMKAIRLPELKLVRITWMDSHYATGWNGKYRATASIPKVRSIGWVTFSDKDILELSSHIGEEGSRLNPTSIPWRSIVEVKEIVYR